MADIHSFNGVLLPAPPPKTDVFYDAYAVYCDGGTYYLARLSQYATTQCWYVDPATNMLYPYGSGYTYVCTGYAWEKTGNTINGDTRIPVEQLIWANCEVSWRSPSSIYPYGGETYMEGSETVLVTSENFTLEALPESCPTVTAFGETGILLGAQIRSSISGEVIDISEDAVYTPREAYARVEETRQLVLLEEGYTGGDVTVDITWAQLPDQTVTLTVPVAVEAGTDKRKLFWLGFSAGTGMYGGLTPGTGETEADGTGEEAFWKGFACGAAMYGGA